MPTRRSSGIKRSMSNIQNQIEDTDGIDLGSKKKRRMDSQPDGINSFPNNVNSKQPQETEYCVNDNNDGTYTATIQSKICQLGQHQLSITINGQAIQGSPFRLEVVPQRDYHSINDRVQVVDNAGRPRCIAFSDDGNMFVTCSDKSICVYDSTGQWKTTIGSIKGDHGSEGDDSEEGDGSEGDDKEEEGDGSEGEEEEGDGSEEEGDGSEGDGSEEEGDGSEGDEELQFNDPWGLAVSGDIIYVTENFRHRVCKLTTGGEFLGTYGEKGTSAGQLTYPTVIGISPDGKIYVSDGGNCVQVFNPDWSLSHVIDGLLSLEGLAFDLSGNVHVAHSNSILVFSPTGNPVRQYGGEHLSEPGDIAIDSSGYSIVLDYGDGQGSLSIFDPTGQFIRSTGPCTTEPFSVAISPTDGSIWLSDDKRLVKY